MVSKVRDWDRLLFKVRDVITQTTLLIQQGDALKPTGWSETRAEYRCELLVWEELERCLVKLVSLDT